MTPDPPASRDRDPAGRARNSRPRDGLGRPLPRGAAGVERVPDELVLPPEESLAEAQRLLDADRPFHAHEVLEGTWKSAPPGERDLWQGLAQVAVGLTHARRGNARGAVTLLRRGTERIRYRPAHPGEAASPSPGPPPPGEGHLYGMDIPAVLAAADDLACRIERDGLDHIPAADFAPRLLAGDR